jgi:hypothetical protein
VYGSHTFIPSGATAFSAEPQGGGSIPPRLSFPTSDIAVCVETVSTR